MSRSIIKHLTGELATLKDIGLYKEERVIESSQSSAIKVQASGEVLNFCANNYLGLSDDPGLVVAAKKALDEYGFGLSSVRFICGTQDIHKELEARLSRFLGQEDTILYSSCFDANAGLFETILGAEDAVISDALNHASIIDGVRLCKAKRYRYANSDMAELERCLIEAQDQRFRLIVTDGVFSMDGYIANLPAICDLADKYDALVMVDDSHSVGFMGPNGAGTPDYWGLRDRVDIITGTLGKALGGASGGYTAASKEIVDWLRQRSRPYLFSNSLAPVITATTLAVLDRVESGKDMRAKLVDNSNHFRKGMTELGFDLLPGEHPIIPVMIGEAALATKLADALLKRGIYVIGFSFPVVPKGQARIRTQMSAVHSTEQINRAIVAFGEAGKELGII